MNKKKNKGMGIVYARYILPVAADVILTILMCFPVVRYALNSEIKERMSLWELVSNAWSTSRNYLFSSGTTPNAEGKTFYTTVLVALILCVLLFMIGIAVNLFTLICAANVYASRSEKNKDRPIKNLYITFIPNRAVYLLLRALPLPLAFFPYLLVLFYRRLLLYKVGINPTALIVAIGAVALFIATVIITAIAKKYELRFDVNIFSRKKTAISSENYRNGDPAADEPDDPDEYRVYQMKKASRDEQTERLRKLLGFDEDDT